MKRRDFLIGSGILAASTPFRARGASAGRVDEALFSGAVNEATPAVFSSSVASGDPQASGIVLWTRIEPATLPGGQTSASVGWQISEAPDFSAVVLQGMADAVIDNDYTVKVRVSHPALLPWTRYYYRFGFNGVISKTGRFRTLPGERDALPKLRLGFLSCQDYGHGYYTALTAMAAENLDYVVHLGDYIYESIADPNFQSGQVRAVPPLPSGQLVATGLADYRHLYQVYRSDANLQRVHENYAFIQIWDDHEFANDSYQQYHPDNNPNPTQPTPQLRQDANQAWSEYTPAAPAFDPGKGPLASLQIYRSFRFGTLAELVMTDERLYRAGPPCGLDEPNRYLTPGCPERESQSRTMLSVTQRDWFVNQMKSSPAIWKIWGNEVMQMGFKVLNGPNTDVFLNLDQWDGYPEERSYLMGQLLGTPNIVTIDGDIHSFGAGYMKTSYDSVLAPRVGVEFIGGSATSSNLAEELASTGNSVSAPLPKAAIQQAFPGGLIEFIARLMNPHLTFFNSDTHGYGVLEITPQALNCTLRNVSTIRQRVATVSTLASFTVPNGQIVMVPG